MSSNHKQLSARMIPRYSENAVLQLVSATGVGYVVYLFITVAFQVFGKMRLTEAINTVKPYVALPSRDLLLSKVWTVFIYGWAHNGFWEWLTNMVWLWCFGSILQALIGYKQLIPLFIYGMITGGLVYAGSLYIPDAHFITAGGILGAQAAIMAIMAAMLTVAPTYKLYLSQDFAIPAWIFALIFTALMVLQSHQQANYLAMLAGGALCGVIYASLVKNGYKPGVWAYDLLDKMEASVTPDERAPSQRQREDQSRVDELLDKINQKGYQSLTKEEKDVLAKASRDKS